MSQAPNLWIEFIKQQDVRLSSLQGVDVAAQKAAQGLWRLWNFPVLVDFDAEQALAVRDAAVRFVDGVMENVPSGEKAVLSWFYENNKQAYLLRSSFNDANLLDLSTSRIKEALSYCLRYLGAERMNQNRVARGQPLVRVPGINGPLKLNPAEPFTSQGIESVTQLVSLLEGADFSSVLLGPDALGMDWSPMVRDVVALKKALKGADMALSLGGRLQVVLTGQRQSATQSCGGLYWSESSSVTINHPSLSTFTHEWMHAVDHVSKKNQASGMGALRKSVKHAKQSLRRMRGKEQDVSAVKDEVKDFIIMQCSSMINIQVCAMLPKCDPDKVAWIVERGEQYKSWKKQWARRCLLNNADIHARAFWDELDGFLPSGAARADRSVPPKAFTYGAVLPEMLAKANHQITSMEILSQLVDMRHGDHYTAKTEEMLSRAAEFHIHPGKMGIGYPSLREEATVAAIMAPVIEQVCKLFQGIVPPKSSDGDSNASVFSVDDSARLPVAFSRRV